MRPHQVEGGEIADPLVKLGRAFEVGKQKGQAGDLQPLVDIDRVRAVEVAKHLVSQEPLGGQKWPPSAEKLVELVSGGEQSRQDSSIGAVLERQAQRPGTQLHGTGRHAQLVDHK
jgi:hypothetical protein